MANPVLRTLEAYLPGTTEEDRRDMWISPFFADMKKMKVCTTFPARKAADDVCDSCRRPCSTVEIWIIYWMIAS